MIDTRDAHLAPALEALGRRVSVTETLMTTRERSITLARNMLDCAGTLRKDLRHAP
jgi:hypothetical protein